MPITFNMILKAEGIDPADVRVVRHHDTRPECKIAPYGLWRRDPTLLEKYQNIQRKDRFQVGKLLASFVRTPSDKTLFVGLYAVNAKGATDEHEIDPCSGLPCPGMVLYKTSRDDRLNDMRGRLVVDWGKGYLAWHQRANKNDKPVVELLRDPEDEPFPGYFVFRSRLTELADIPLTWKAQLRAAKGVYVLTSATTREHYVGSATGRGGFFERWAQHAKVRGDAVGFRALGPSEYQVSILQVSAGFETDDDILRTEYAWMEKLQSRNMGINGNPPAVSTHQQEPQSTSGVLVPYSDKHSMDNESA
jgi:GIY-YIG catalytic domain